MTYALMALGLSIIFGTLGLINFAHGDFIMLAMYGGFLFSLCSGMDPYWGLFILLPVAFVLGIAFYRFLFKKLIDAPEESHIIAKPSAFICISVWNHAAVFGRVQE